MNATKKGKISFAANVSDYLACSCRRDVLDNSLEAIESNCGATHYECNGCNSVACISFAFDKIQSVEDCAKEIATKKGQISFATATSEFLACSCGNDVMDSGFEVVDADCENMHYQCCKCEASACVDFAFRIINNEK